MIISLSARTKFQQKIRHFAGNNRRQFPWRQTHRPYPILVSEVMLQQTQTDRVIRHYRSFLKKFPSLKALSQAPLADVITAWQGLGYNRRARYLWEFARLVVRNHRGQIPKDPQLLRTLPGVGIYTANAVAVFAFGQALPMIETNIRAAYIDHFFPKKAQIDDREIMPLIEQTIDQDNPREWFYALMDYGSHLKKTRRDLTRRSSRYVKQSKFVGSRRQLRGIILRRLMRARSLTLRSICDLNYTKEEKRAVLQRMCAEGLIMKRAGKYLLAQI